MNALTRPTRALKVPDLGGGLNRAAETIDVRDNETTDELNMDHTGPTSRTKRYGTESYANIFDATGKTVGQFVFTKRDGTKLHIAAFDNGTEVKICSEVANAWVAFKAGLTTGKPVNFAEALIPGAEAVSGTPSAVTTNTLTDSTKTWTENQYRGYFVEITSGTGVGQIRLISGNSTNKLTLSEDWKTQPTTSSAYKIKAVDTILVYGNGTDPTGYWSGTGTPTDIAGAPEGSILAVWKGRLYIADGTTIYFSSPYSVIDWKVDNTAGFIINPTTSPLTGLLGHPSEEILLIFTAEDVRRGYFDGSQIFVISDPVDCEGAVSYRTICKTNNDVIYLSKTGVRMYGQQAQYTGLRVDDTVSTAIEPVIKQIVNAENAAAVVNNQRYYLACQLTPGTGGNDTLLVLDLRYASRSNPRGVWKYWDGIKAATLTDFNDRLHFGLTSAARVTRQCDEHSTAPFEDIGQPIDAYLETKAFDLGEPFVEKYFQYLDFVVRNLVGTLTIGVTVEDQDNQSVEEFEISVGSSLPDGSFATSEFGAALFGSGEYGDESYSVSEYLRERLELVADGHTIKFKFSNANRGETFTLISFTCWLKFYGVGRQAISHIH
jgi:hypothetical protein